jgi:AcrR family transcriptional regulator
MESGTTTRDPVLPKDVEGLPPRDRLLWSMARIVSEKGYESTTVADVVARAGVSRTTFDVVFTDKDECLFAAYDWVVDQVLMRVAADYELGAAVSWAEGVRRGLESLLETIAEEPLVARMALVDIPSMSAEAHAHYRAALVRLASLLRGGRDFLAAEIEPPPQVELMALGGAEVILVDEVSAGRTDQLPARLPDILFAILVPYLGPEAAADEMYAAAA